MFFWCRKGGRWKGNDRFFEDEKGMHRLIHFGDRTRDNPCTCLNESIIEIDELC